MRPGAGARQQGGDGDGFWGLGRFEGSFWAGQAIFQGETERWFIVPILLIFDELTLRSDWVILWRGEALVTWNLKQAGDTNRRSGFERRGWQESFPLYAGLNKRLQATNWLHI